MKLSELNKEVTKIADLFEVDVDDIDLKIKIDDDTSYKLTTDGIEPIIIGSDQNAVVVIELK